MKIKIEIISGVEGDCICINGYRVAGPKPWGGGKITKTWDAQLSDIEEAIRHLSEASTRPSDSADGENAPHLCECGGFIDLAGVHQPCRVISRRD